MKKNIKFIRNIIITLIALFLVAIIINFTPGYRRDKYKDLTNLVIGEENVTEFLTYQIYMADKENIYIAEQDIKKLITDNQQFENYKDMITIGDIIYIPVKNLEELNLKTEYIEISDTLIIDKSSATLQKATISENTMLKYKPRELSKTVTEISEGEEIIYFDTLIRNWRLVRTKLGETGYVEEDKIIKEEGI